MARASLASTGDDAGSAEDAFRTKFGQMLDVFANGFDIVTPEVFLKVWQGKGVDEALAAAVLEGSGEGAEINAIVNFIVKFTNPK